MTRNWSRLSALIAVALVVSACGDTSLAEIGRRSSDWINAPEVVTTTLPPTTVPLLADASILQWANDGIVSLNPDDPETLIEEIFQRREGDRFIQASRAEIATVLPGVLFPSVVPTGAEWVSSQLVINNDGQLSDEPSAAFGIWSAEPYTRSRSVAQMATLTISNDLETATRVAEEGTEISCGAFSNETTTGCDALTVDGRPVWRLVSNGGETFIWFDDSRRYELFGRSFVPDEAMVAMVTDLALLAEVDPVSS